jgi:HTH-type transcriptional regulator/antitoxin HigA
MIAVLERPDVLEGVPRVITSEAQNERYISVLLQMERRGNLTAAEKNLAELLTLLIEAYEEENYPIRSASPVKVLKELMEANNLRQKDLAPMLASEGAVSEVLHGRRKLNRNHIERLSKRFNVSAVLFF